MIGDWVCWSGVANGVMLASHTMPDFVTPVVRSLLAWNAIPIAVTACWGAGIGCTRLAWKPFLLALAGWVTGLLALMPFALLFGRFESTTFRSLW